MKIIKHFVELKTTMLSIIYFKNLFICNHVKTKADYLKAHAQMNAPNTEADPGTNNNMYASNGFNGLQQAQVPAMTEPMAANSFGGFSSW